MCNIDKKHPQRRRRFCPITGKPSVTTPVTVGWPTTRSQPHEDRIRAMIEPLVTIHDYYNGVSALELDGCLPFFGLPCMFIGLRGTFAVTSREDLAKVLGPTLEALKTKDYQRSEFIETQLTTLTD